MISKPPQPASGPFMLLSHNKRNAINTATIMMNEIVGTHTKDTQALRRKAAETNNPMIAAMNRSE